MSKREDGLRRMRQAGVLSMRGREESERELASRRVAEARRITRQAAGRCVGCGGEVDERHGRSIERREAVRGRLRVTLVWLCAICAR